MKVLIYRYGSVCEPDIIAALEQLQFQVIEETIEIHNKEITPAQSLEIVQKHLTEHTFSFVFTINFFPWLSDLCNLHHLPYLSLIVDSPVLELYSNSIQHPCNRIFLFDSALYTEFAPYNPDCIFYMPLATNVRHNDQICSSANAADIKKYQADISFVDTFCAHAPDMFHFPENFRPNYKALVAQQYLSVKAAEQERIRILKLLSETNNVTIYTQSDTSMLPQIHNRGFAEYATEMPLISRHSKINLNITAKSIRNGLSLRVFDVLGCGRFLITNYQTDLDDVFTAGVELETYASMEELLEKVNYYMKHDTEREQIAKNGYEKVKKYHSYDVRFPQMLQLSFPS